jgi:photosystem II stability/assembly factor-like uncharacterized protein
MTYLHSFAIHAIGLALAVAQPVAAATFQSPLDQPAAVSRLATHSPLLAVTTAGNRVIAAGQRGHIVYSDDGGETWTQAAVPVSTDLVALSFPSARQGWVVGHGGVVLHTADGGATWNRQLDGRQSSEIAIRYLQSLAATHPGAEKLVAREKRLVEEGGIQPLLGVYFENETTGYVVGTFNRIFRTDDGGKSWTPWMDHTDNPNELHFNAIVGGVNGIFLAGEQGMVWSLDPQKNRFVARPTPYQGSLFGLVANGANTLLAYGLRGSLFRSVDDGKSWEKVSVGSSAGITSGAALPDGSIVLAIQAGAVVRSTDHGKTFAPVKLEQPMAYYGITRSTQGAIVLAGSEGVRRENVGR